MSWAPTDTAIPGGIEKMLRLSREMFVHHYFVYELGAVAAVWSLLALEAALRERLDPSGDDRTPFRTLIKRLGELGLVAEETIKRIDIGRELRNRLVHARGQNVMTPGMSAGIIEASHKAVVALWSPDFPNVDPTKG